MCSPCYSFFLLNQVENWKKVITSGQNDKTFLFYLERKKSRQVSLIIIRRSLLGSE